MILEDSKAREACRAIGRCEWCGSRIGPFHCAHIFSVGAGRVDSAWNMVSLCPACHSSQHNGGEPKPMQLGERAAYREKIEWEDIKELVGLVRRTQSWRVTLDHEPQTRAEREFARIIESRNQ